MSSVKLNETDELDYTPFLLSTVSENMPTFFEIVFFSRTKKYRYGFEYNATEIINEWLFEIKKTKEIPFFIRTKDGIAVSNYFPEGKDKETATNKNRLFISLVAQLGGETSKQIIEWFDNYCNIISGIEHVNHESFSLKMFVNRSKGYEESLKLFQKLQLGFKNIEIENYQIGLTNLPKEIPNYLKSKPTQEIPAANSVNYMQFKTIHNKYNKQGKAISTLSWERDKYESEGTKKIIDLSGLLFDTLLKGKVLVVDELDAKLHPLITMQIINLFNNPETNPNNAQLLFATHDTNLLSTEIFRRDQVWFTEKDNREQTDLYSLDDFVFADGSKVRKDANLEKNYIAGRYGAIPYITNL
jgi:AAA15 family ATPase/GTPase